VFAIVAASGALYPSIYLDAGMNTTAAAAVNADYIAGAVQEALRLAKHLPPSALQPLVRAFAKPNYRDGECELNVFLKAVCGCDCCIGTRPSA
jgi:hypothetical protein